MSPSDLGQVLKPFVFLDLFDLERASFPGIGLHPHSGIATVSYLFEGSIRYEDTTGATGVLAAGGVEWFKAGHGAWHGGGPGDTGRARGFQLWLALPADHELGPRGEPVALVVNGEDKVEQRTLKTERTVGDRWLISNGVKPGERVIVEGGQRIHPGDAVRPVEWRAARVTNAPAAGVR